MKRLLYAAGLLFLILATLFAAGPAAGQRPEEEDETDLVTISRDGHSRQTRVLKEAPDPDEGRPARAGSLIVKFREGAGAGERDESHRQAGALKTEALYLSDAVRVQVGASRMALALVAYRSRPDVEYAESDRIVRAILTPNDPSFGQQWGMTKINASQAWDISLSSGATRIAILDCGVFSPSSAWGDANGFPDGHPDVGPKVVLEKNFSTSTNVDDFCNHGTHVAGIAAATTNNGIGVAGVGYNASIVNGKVLGDNGSGSFSSMINGIIWAAGCDTNPCGSRRAEVINMSLGATGSCSLAVQDAIDKAWSQGLVIVAAAGNSNANGSITPGNCNNVISVAASDQNDAKASFSNFGVDVDVAAPSVSILSTNFVGGYSSFNGTSMASPHVAGLAALLWTTPHNTSNLAVVNRIFDKANKSFLAGSTQGRIDAFASVAPDGPPPPPVHDMAVTGIAASPASVQVGNTTTISVTVQNQGNHAESGITLSLTDGPGGPLIGSQPVSLGARASTTAAFSWNASGVGLHTLFATIATHTGETDTGDNTAATTVSVNAGPTNTGFLNCGANAAVTSDSGDNNGFEVSAANACADDGLFAVDNNSGTKSNTSCTSNKKDKHNFFNYGFALPGGATIQGIEVRLDAKVDSTAGSPKICVQLSWDGGANWTTAKSTTTLTISEASYILGGATDTWGRTWSSGDFSNANFRVRVINVASLTSRDFSLDVVAVRATYTP